MQKLFITFIICISCSILKAQGNNDEIPPPPPPPVDVVVPDSTQPRVSDFIKEIEQVNDRDHRMAIIFWMPWQYWETAFKQATGSTLNDTQQDLINTLKNYNIIIVADAEINPYYPIPVYTDDQKIRDSIYLRVNDSLKMKPIPESSLDSKVKTMFRIMQPLLKNMLGDMGDHLSYFAFENVNKNGQYIMDAQKPGKFVVSWKTNTTFEFRLPLDVLTPPKYCPVDGEKESGKFIYCPYHGVKLNSSPK